MQPRGEALGMRAGEQHRSLEVADQDEQNFLRYSVSENTSQKHTYRDELFCDQIFKVRE